MMKTQEILKQIAEDIRQIKEVLIQYGVMTEIEDIISDEE